uniref:Carboxypeptidase n=1 Tax=Steinernema glaseri TaxID=37863 RepID=A0A1I8A6L3_9BILA
MRPLVSLLCLFLLLSPSFSLSYKEKWGYVPVRLKTNLFWWHYFTDDLDRPLVLWLQGGPGASGSGFGNFNEIGPVNARNESREHTWLEKADLLFIDNPVGTGFSYTTDPDGYTKNIDEICQDLLAFFKYWGPRHVSATRKPFYIFSESYGGKMAAAFGDLLYTKVKNGEVKMNFKGVALGDSWISPADYVNSWGEYLYAFSFFGDKELKQYNDQALKCQKLVDQKKWTAATACWGDAESTVESLTKDVSFYNVMDASGMRSKSRVQSTRRRNTIYFYGNYRISPQNSEKSESLEEFMNNEVRQKLGIIPKSVTWQESSAEVFENQKGDFMRPVTQNVDSLLSHNDFKVVVYSGQLDLICDVIGTEKWMSKLSWPYLKQFSEAPRETFDADSKFAGYSKKYKNLEFYSVFNAGHMVPQDNPAGALKMLDMILVD